MESLCNKYSKCRTYLEVLITQKFKPTDIENAKNKSVERGDKNEIDYFGTLCISNFKKNITFSLLTIPVTGILMGIQC